MSGSISSGVPNLLISLGRLTEEDKVKLEETEGYWRKRWAEIKAGNAPNALMNVPEPEAAKLSD